MCNLMTKLASSFYQSRPIIYRGWGATEANTPYPPPPPPPLFLNYNYFKFMQFFTRNWIYTPNFGPKSNKDFLMIRTPSAKYLKFTPSPRFLKVCVYTASKYCLFFLFHSPPLSKSLSTGQQIVFFLSKLWSNYDLHIMHFHKLADSWWAFKDTFK